MRKLILFLAICYTIAIVIVSLISLRGFKEVPEYSDKVIHVLMYFIFVVIWALALSKSSVNKSVKLKLAAISILFGIIIEILQNELTVYRQFSWLDILSNTIGVFIAILAINSILYRLNKFLVCIIAK